MTETSAEILARLKERRPQLIDLSLGRVEMVLSRLGEPHKKLPPVFHIAGTNGKGSVAANLKAVFEAAGQSAHVYTSPHLVDFRERIFVGGASAGYITDELLSHVVAECEKAAGDDFITFFEITTCAAFLAFSEVAADAAIIEVGLGGRLDATNVIEAPVAAIATPVDLDHKDFLGDTVSQIAQEKAGIFKPGRPAVIGRQSPEAEASLLAAATRIGAPAHVFGRQWTVYEDYGRLVYRDHNELTELARPRLAGAHQIDNAGLAVAALRAAGYGFGCDVIGAGLRGAEWPARMQRLRRGPLVDRAQEVGRPDVELWLDGGHNPHAARAVAETLRDFAARAPARLVLVVAMKRIKDARAYFDAFAGLADLVIAPADQFELAMSPDDIAAACAGAGLTAETAPNLAAAFDRALAETPQDGQEKTTRIVFCGSLYFAGEILKENG